MKALKTILCFLFSLFLVFSPVIVSAQEKQVSPDTVKTTEETEATISTEATPSAVEEIIEKIEVVSKKDDITEPTPEIKGKLEKYLADQPIKPLTVTNFLQHTIREMVKRGVPANTIVLILLIPLIAAIIAASRHIIGIRGFGIFLPMVLSVVFVATGILEGLILFLVIIFVATGARNILRKLKLEFLPRMAFLIWLVTMAVFGLLFTAPFLNLTAITNVSIFPVLILILLADSFISIHIGMSRKEAMRMTFQTLVIALISSVILQWDFLQKFVLLKPEIYVLGIAVLDIFMGKYTGLRWLEYRKFKGIVKD